MSSAHFTIFKQPRFFPECINFMRLTLRCFAATLPENILDKGLSLSYLCKKTR